MALKARPFRKPEKNTEELIPPPEGIDPDWRTKIAIAKKIMQEAREARRGKRLAFKTHRMG